MFALLATESEPVDQQTYRLAVQTRKRSPYASAWRARLELGYCLGSLFHAVSSPPTSDVRSSAAWYWCLSCHGASSLAGATFRFARTALAIGLGLMLFGGLAMLVVSMLPQPASRLRLAIVILVVILAPLLLGLADITYPRN